MCHGITPPILAEDRRPERDELLATVVQVGWELRSPSKVRRHVPIRLNSAAQGHAVPVEESSSQHRTELAVVALV